MQGIGSVLERRILPVKPERSYISHEFQQYGLYLAEQLDDMKHKGIYIRMAKNMNRSMLDQALSFVSDSNARNKGSLFMWKVKQLRGIEGK